MSLTPPVIMEEYDTENDNAEATYHSLWEYPNYALYYVSSMFVNVQQLKTNLNVGHQHEKHELIRLNERLCFFIDSVQQLELQNEKYIAKLADFRRQSSNISVFGAEWNERHVHLQADLITVNYEKIGHEFEYELFQMQSEIYKQLIHIINQSSDEQHLKLQHELDYSSSMLINVRTSYAELQKQIDDLHAERDDTFQQYLKMADNRGHWKKQIRELKVSLHALKNQYVFYKQIGSHMVHDSCSVEVFDVKQFLALKWEKIIANIRHDYELLYTSIHRETAVYYEKKMEEVQVEVEQAKIEQTNYYQQVEMNKIEFFQQTLQLEHEEAQKMYTYEKETLSKLEAMFFKLESEFKTIQLQQSEQFEKQSNNLQILQENIITMADNIEEMRRRKIGLESELIIYRHLLEIDGINETVMRDSSSFVHTTTTRTFVVERQETASIGIECPLDCTHICLLNHSPSKEIDISGWMLKRRIDSKTEFKYTLPDKIRLPIGGELKIYSKLGADAAQLPSNYDVVSSRLRQTLVNNSVISWVLGDKIETRLFNEHGEEKASYIQTAASEQIISE